MERYGKYGKAAICATEMIRNYQKNPREAWFEACEKQFGKKHEASIKKGCPRGAYLGLCKAEEIDGVGTGNYTNSLLNAKYALEALKLLRSHSRLASDKPVLWEKVLKKSGVKKAIRHNNQLDVVLALWSEGFIR